MYLRKSRCEVFRRDGVVRAIDLMIVPEAVRRRRGIARLWRRECGPGRRLKNGELTR
jgi:hypothetical protein